MSCYVGAERATNNIYLNCPPMMSDGRAFTDYRPKGVQALQDIVPLNKGSYEFRQHLEAHGKGLMSSMRAMAYANNTCGPCQDPYSTGTLVKELSRESCGPNSCAFVQENQDGIGLGRDFGESHESAENYAEFLEEKRREQAELAKPPCNVSYDPFRDFPMKYDGPPSGRLASY